MSKAGQIRLPVTWCMPEPAVAPSRWQAWTGARLVPEADDEALEQGLGWPHMSLAILREAFRLKLGRGTGWEADGPIAGAVEAVARVYKRGVAVRQDANEPSRAAARSGSYDIEVWGDDAKHPPETLFREGELVIIDQRVFRAWPSLMALPRAHVFDLDEHSKTLESVARILEAWRHGGLAKAWCVIGGGVLSDTAAFAAGLAGCTVRFVPTTLLAMADACVGGKTGVNFAPFGKNQVGLFYFPTRVDTWTGWLRTLPERELRAGGVECLKHAFLDGDVKLARELATALRDKDLAALARALPAVIGLKAKIVAEDPGESGKRAILNLGHTLGHALEAYSQERTIGDDTILHGEAVGIGLAFALKLSVHAGKLAPETAHTMLALLEEAHVLVPAKQLERALGGVSLHDPKLLSELMTLAAHDKKATDAAVLWVLLEDWGRAARTSDGAWTVPVDAPAIARAWSELST